MSTRSFNGFSWEAFSDSFDFDTDSDPGAIADAVAREKWTKRFWQNLRRYAIVNYVKVMSLF